MTFRTGGWRFAGKADRCLTPPSTSCSGSVMPPLSRTSASGEILAWIKEQQDRQPHLNTIPKGPRRSNQGSGLLKNRAMQMTEAAKSNLESSPPQPAPLRYDGLRGAGSRSQRGRRVTFQLCANRDISTLLQHTHSQPPGGASIGPKTALSCRETFQLACFQLARDPSA